MQAYQSRRAKATVAMESLNTVTLSGLLGVPEMDLIDFNSRRNKAVIEGRAPRQPLSDVSPSTTANVSRSTMSNAMAKPALQIVDLTGKASP